MTARSGSPATGDGLGTSRHVMLTGGIGAIGQAVGLRLARDGHRVTLVDLAGTVDGRRAIERLAADDPVAFERLDYLQADVTSPGAIGAAIDALPALDIAIANAGIVRSSPFLEISAADWQDHLDVNLSGAFHTAQAAARRFVRDGTAGLLIFTSSWVAEVPWPEIAAYTVTKSGLEMLARQAARELAPYGIRANLVAPGIVAAGMAKQQYDTEPQYRERVGRVVPLRSLQTVDSVAGAFSYLCSPDGDYLTGTTLLADGGASLHAFD